MNAHQISMFEEEESIRKGERYLLKEQIESARLGKDGRFNKFRHDRLCPCGMCYERRESQYATRIMQYAEVSE